MKPDFALSRNEPRLISAADAAFPPDVPSKAWSDNG